jgi:hypothetical protein
LLQETVDFIEERRDPLHLIDNDPRAAWQGPQLSGESPGVGEERMVQFLVKEV